MHIPSTPPQACRPGSGPPRGPRERTRTEKPSSPPQYAPRRPQEAPKRAQETPKRPLEAPKRSKRGRKRPLSRSPEKAARERFRGHRPAKMIFLTCPKDVRFPAFSVFRSLTTAPGAFDMFPKRQRRRTETAHERASKSPETSQACPWKGSRRPRRARRQRRNLPTRLTGHTMAGEGPDDGPIRFPQKNKIDFMF